MARRVSSGPTPDKSKNTDSVTPEVPEEVTPEVTEESSEAPVAEAESTEEAPAAPVEPDLSDFKGAVTTAIEGRDTATGDVPDGLSSAVVAEYRKIDGLKAKNAAKSHLKDLIEEGMNQLKIDLARAPMKLLDAVIEAGSARSTAEKAPADPTEAYVQHTAALNLAYGLVTANVPEGVSADWEASSDKLVEESREDAASYLAWFTSDDESRGDEPEVSSVVKAAVKLSQGKAARVTRTTAGRTYSGVRRDIGKHIEQAFADQEPGTFLTIAQIKSFRSEEYGDDTPSPGAISARLFPSGGGKCTLDFVKPGQNSDGNKGATKVA
jgi:hypothetical protein